MPKCYTRRALFALAPASAAVAVATLAACGAGGADGATPTAALPSALPPTPTVVISTITVVVRSGSAVIPSPTGQSATTATPTPMLPPVPTGSPPPTIALPTATTGIVLPPLSGGTPYTTPDGRTTLRHPNDWDAQTVMDASYFYPRGAMGTDPATPRANLIGQTLQLNLLAGDNATMYVQTIAQQSRDRGATDLIVRSVDRVALGGPGGPPALRIVVTYTLGVPVVSQQIIVQPPNSDRTYFFISVAPAADFEAKWRGILDGMAGSLTFK